MYFLFFFFFFSSRRRHTRCSRDWSSDVCSSDLAAVFGDSLRTHHLSQWLYAKTFGHPYFLAFVSRQLLALAHGSLVDPEALWPAIFKRLEHEKFRSDLAQVTERSEEHTSELQSRLHLVCRL